MTVIFSVTPFWRTCVRAGDNFAIYAVVCRALSTALIKPFIGRFFDLSFR